jgi:site-specific DNA recombinase
MLSVRGAVSEYERAKILQRSKLGREARAKKGLPMAYQCVPYGYVYENNELKIHPEESKIVRRIFALRLSGIGIMKIVRLLSAEGIPTRSDMGLSVAPKTRGQGVWSPSTIHRMLRSTTYIGKSHYNKRMYVEATKKPRKPRNDKHPKRAHVYRLQEEWIEIPCPQIIDLDTWNAAQSPYGFRQEVWSPHATEARIPFSLWTCEVRHMWIRAKWNLSS